MHIAMYYHRSAHTIGANMSHAARRTRSECQGFWLASLRGSVSVCAARRRDAARSVSTGTEVDAHAMMRGSITHLRVGDSIDARVKIQGFRLVCAQGVVSVSAARQMR